MIEKRIGRAEAASFFPPLADRANKGDMGRVLVVCGSYDPSGLSMCGAAYFAAKAAYLCGAGIVEIFTPRENYTALASLVPEAVFSLYGYDEKCDSVASRLAESMKKSDSVVLGCGLGKSDLAREIVACVLENVRVPLLIDADGLNTLSQMDLRILKQATCRVVLTPHLKEFERLSNIPITEIEKDPVTHAAAFAKEYGVCLLLKGCTTVITDGTHVYLVDRGCAGMAPAGSGDVLSGILAGILGYADVSPLSVACGAYIAGRAGEIAEKRCNPVSMVASDTVAAIAEAISELL